MRNIPHYRQRPAIARPYSVIPNYCNYQLLQLLKLESARGFPVSQGSTTSLLLQKLAITPWNCAPGFAKEHFLRA
jgi:hypothetical protein